MPPIYDFPFCILIEDCHMYLPRFWFYLISHLPSQTWVVHHFLPKPPYRVVESNNNVSKAYNFDVKKVTEKTI